MHRNNNKLASRETRRVQNKTPTKARPAMKPLLVAAVLVLCSCCSVPTFDTSCYVPTSGRATLDNSIVVDEPEIYENANLQAQLDLLRSQLANLSVINQPALVGAIGNLQGARIEQSGLAIEATAGRGLPQISTTTPALPGTAPSAEKNNTQTVTQAAVPPSVPSVPSTSAGALPSISPSAIGLLDQQMQLSSQLLSYQLLLTGSEFARYTPGGGEKDRIVIGFPITILPQSVHKNMAAEVEVIYYPPNAKQYEDPSEFQNHDPADTRVRKICDPNNFLSGEPHASEACHEQTAAVTIVNILPAERSYNTVGVTTDAKTFGIGSVIGTVNLGASTSSSSSTEYVVAQQDTVAYQEGRAGAHAARRSEPAEGQGVKFKWQFRPVLGEQYVRAGPRRVFVQLAIPYARRPYPNYGGTVEISSRWQPFHADTGVVDQTAIQGLPAATSRPVLGHPFSSATVSNLDVKDLGGGSILVSVTGKFLIGASVRVGSTLIDAATAGFSSSYSGLKFITTAQSIAQNGAVIVSSGGVDTPLVAKSLCRAFDQVGECFRDWDDEKNQRIRIQRIVIEPVSDTTSLVRITAAPSLSLRTYVYHHYYRDPTTGVVGEQDADRKPDSANQDLNDTLVPALNRLPIVVTAGGKTYGFSDLPLTLLSDSELSFVASNETINMSPQVKVQRLFGDPGGDSEAAQFVPPGGIAVTPLEKEGNAANKDAPDKKHCDAKSCDYAVSGAFVEDMKWLDPRDGCSVNQGGVAHAAQVTDLGHNARKVTVAKESKQLAFEVRIGKVCEVGVASLDGAPAGPQSKTVTATKIQSTVSPSFNLVRTVQKAFEIKGVAYITVGVKKLGSGETATVAVSNADVMSATDGAGAAISIQPGNQVQVAQDSSITFGLRNADPSNVNVTAEGMKGKTSTGKVTFASNFEIIRLK